jgi:hypothetical protein
MKPFLAKSFLAKLSAIESAVEAKKQEIVPVQQPQLLLTQPQLQQNRPEVSNEGSEEEEGEEVDGWLSSNHRKADKTVRTDQDGDIHDTKVVKVKLSELVFIKLPFRGGAGYFCGRRCQDEEIITERAVEWPLKENHVVVEIFNVPKAMAYRLCVVDREDIHPYFLPPPSKTDHQIDYDRTCWNVGLCDKMQAKV